MRDKLLLADSSVHKINSLAHAAGLQKFFDDIKNLINTRIYVYEEIEE